MAENIFLVMGIDEAGRGPVIGDMVIAITVFREDMLKIISNLGVRDSKSLVPSIREKLVPYIIKYSVITVLSHVSPMEIDLQNLNKLTIERISYLLETLSKIINPLQVKRIAIDMITGYRKYCPNYKQYFPNAEIIFDVDADEKYIEVSAASIIAKYYRDQLIKGLAKYYGDIGSGYPTDKKTINWIRNIYKKGLPPPAFIRRSWKVINKIAPEWYMNKKKELRKNKQKRLTNFLNL